MKGNLIIISSPSGGGKGTLIKEVRKHHAGSDLFRFVYDAADQAG